MDYTREGAQSRRTNLDQMWMWQFQEFDELLEQSCVQKAVSVFLERVAVSQYGQSLKSRLNALQPSAIVGKTVREPDVCQKSHLRNETRVFSSSYVFIISIQPYLSVLGNVVAFQKVVHYLCRSFSKFVNSFDMNIRYKVRLTSLFCTRIATRSAGSIGNCRIFCVEFKVESCGTDGERLKRKVEVSKNCKFHDH